MWVLFLNVLKSHGVMLGCKNKVLKGDRRCYGERLKGDGAVKDALKGNRKK